MSPDTPNLYRVETSQRGGQVQDVFRTPAVSAPLRHADGRIYLNGQPIYLRGVLDQAYYPETIYTIPSVEYLEDQARKAKASASTACVPTSRSRTHAITMSPTVSAC